MTKETIEEKKKRLEKELNDIHEIQQKEQLKKQNEKEAKFREEHDIDVYTSDDYCGMTCSKYSFYFGYEVTECPIKSHKDEEDCDNKNCDKREWCFVASIDDKDVMKKRASQIWFKEGDEPFFYLLAGIGLFLKERHKYEK